MHFVMGKCNSDHASNIALWLENRPCDGKQKVTSRQTEVPNNLDVFMQVFVPNSKTYKRAISAITRRNEVCVSLLV